MRVKEGFIVRKIANQYMAVPVGTRTKEVHGMIGLNEAGVFLWNQMVEEKTEQELVSALCKEYEIDEERAILSVRRFCEKVKKEGLFADD